MATTAKKTKKRSPQRRSRSLAGLPDKKQVAPMLKAVGMLALGLTVGYAANDMIGNLMPKSATTSGFDLKGLIAPVVTLTAGMLLVNNPTLKYAGLGLSAAGALKTVAAIIQKDPLSLPELRFIKAKETGIPTATTTPSGAEVKGIGNVPYLEFDEDDDLQEEPNAALSENTVNGLGSIPTFKML